MAMHGSREAERVMSLAEAAATLQISYFRAHNLMLVGRLEGVRCGHRWMIKRRSVERLADGRQAGRVGVGGPADA